MSLGEQFQKQTFEALTGGKEVGEMVKGRRRGDVVTGERGLRCEWEGLSGELVGRGQG